MSGSMGSSKAHEQSWLSAPNAWLRHKGVPHGVQTHEVFVAALARRTHAECTMMASSPQKIHCMKSVRATSCTCMKNVNTRAYIIRACKPASRGKLENLGHRSSGRRTFRSVPQVLQFASGSHQFQLAQTRQIGYEATEVSRKLSSGVDAIPLRTCLNACLHVCQTCVCMPRWTLLFMHEKCTSTMVCNVHACMDAFEKCTPWCVLSTACIHGEGALLWPAIDTKDLRSRSGCGRTTGLTGAR